MILVLLAQMSLQAWVDKATDQLIVPPLTVTVAPAWEHPVLEFDPYMWVEPPFVHVSPLMPSDVPNDVLAYLAYHEVCHVALGHKPTWDPIVIKQQQYEADLCALDHLTYARRRHRAWKDWVRRLR